MCGHGPWTRFGVLPGLGDVGCTREELMCFDESFEKLESDYAVWKKLAGVEL